MTQNDTEYLPTNEAMKYLGIGRTRLYAYIRDKKLKTYKNQSDNPHLSYFSKTEMDAIKEAKSKPRFVPADELRANQSGG